MDWITHNLEWLFGGLGVFVLSILWTKYYNRPKLSFDAVVIFHLKQAGSKEVLSNVSMAYKLVNFGQKAISIHKIFYEIENPEGSFELFGRPVSSFGFGADPTFPIYLRPREKIELTLEDPMIMDLVPHNIIEVYALDAMNTKFGLSGKSLQILKERLKEALKQNKNIK